MAEWRYAIGWTEQELEKRLAQVKQAGLNFPPTGPDSQYGSRWNRYYSESPIGREAKGPPRETFAVAWKAVSEYQFSAPDIVVAHFHPKDPLRGRTMLLELKVLGLRYLCGVRVGSVRKRESENQTELAYRYDTLEGHIETGSEWFSVIKHHDTGEIWFRISASWRHGDFPNLWSQIGFELFGRHFQLKWHHLAYARLRTILGDGGKGLVPIPWGEELVHTGPEIQASDIWVANEFADV
jgi:uncharacterized protein (UPF0548 family)